MPLKYRRFWIGSVCLLVLVIVAASLVADPGPAAAVGHDKLGHMAAYFLLTLVGAAIVPATSVPRVMARAFLLGLALEGAQALLTETRNADWLDVLANAAGVLAAWCVVHGGRAGWALAVEAWLDRRQRH